MPRDPIGPRPLTPAERQAHQRQKHRQAYERLVNTLEVIASPKGAPTITVARELAAVALRMNGHAKRERADG